MKYIVMPFLAVLLSCVSAAGEDIIDSSWSCHNNGNGAINCTSTWGENWGVYQVSISGDQFLTPGFMLTQFDTYSADDPTSNVVHFITNDSDNGLGWVAYSATVELYASSPLTSSSLSAAVSNPGNWTVSSFQPFTLVSSKAPQFPGLPAGLPYEYVGQIIYSGPTIVQPGEELDFSYKESFKGSLHYAQIEVLTPTYALPEPGTLALLGSGLLGLLFARRRAWRLAKAA